MITESHYTLIETPIGELFLAASNTALVRVEFEGVQHEIYGVRGENPVLRLARQQLSQYFAGNSEDFDLPFEMTGTELQLKVWRALERIPFGKTKTYGELALALTKSLSTARAVGTCCGRNPLPIIIPCHRVVGSNGSLTGFGGGIWRKQWLLRHEGALELAL